MAQDYFTKAKESLAEMVRQAGSPVFDPATGLMKRGVIVRHLLLPGHTKDSKKILRYLHTTYGNQIFISIMNQYTPLPQVKELPELNRRYLLQNMSVSLTLPSVSALKTAFSRKERLLLIALSRNLMREVIAKVRHSSTGII